MVVELDVDAPILESRIRTHGTPSQHELVDEADHVLWRDAGEPCDEFVKRVKRAVGALARATSLGRISYIATPGPEVASTRQDMLERLVILLEGGAKLGLLAPSSMDLIEAVDPLLAVAKTGVQVRAVHWLASVSTARARTARAHAWPDWASPLCACASSW